MVIVCVLLRTFNPVGMPLAPRCLVKLATGLSCPACGIQRALHAALNGSWAEALSYNYFLLFALPYALMVCLVWYLPEGGMKERWQRRLEGPIAVRIFVVSLVAWMAARNILGI